jgi:peptidoglycan/xylan/chitin deacetylase (PgdA/CDA1 family)
MMRIAKGLVRLSGLQRTHVAAARMFCERHALATIPASPKREGGRILCYHSIGQPECGVNDVTPMQFRRHIEFALHAGFRFVPAAQIAETGGAPNDLAITFDDAMTSVLTQAAPILREYSVPWSLFVVSNWSDHRDAWSKERILPWRDLETLLRDGAELGSHSVTHPDFGKIALPQMVHELEASRRIIEARLGVTIRTFAVPYGQSMNWPAAAAGAARDAGYEIVYAQAEHTRPSGTIARTFITRFDGDRTFKAALRGAYDRWEEWV